MAIEDLVGIINCKWAIHVAGSDFLCQERVHVGWVDISQAQIIRNEGV